MFTDDRQTTDRQTTDIMMIIPLVLPRGKNLLYQVGMPLKMQAATELNNLRGSHNALTLLVQIQVMGRRFHLMKNQGRRLTNVV